MALLAEYALTPDVFEANSYGGSDELRLAHLRIIKDALLRQGIVRDLRNGDWARLLISDQRPWHHRVKELLKKLKEQNRLIQIAPSLPADPNSDSEWCSEALATHKPEAPLVGVIVTRSIADAFHSEPKVASIDRLESTPWWTSCNESMRLHRTLDDYRAALDIVLRRSHSIMFIDPHINPVEMRYRDFITLMQAAGNRHPRPLIEIHRVCYRGSGKNREILDPATIEAEFRKHLTSPLTTVGLAADVFVWDDFHDRYVISDWVGIIVPNGFDTTKAPDSMTTWSRLSVSDCEDVRREFEPAYYRHKKRHQFRIA